MSNNDPTLYHRASGQEVRTAVNDNDPSFADDLMRTGTVISKFLGIKRRAFYNLVEKGGIPVFTLGTSVICARKSVLLKWVADQEARRLSNGGSGSSK